MNAEQVMAILKATGAVSEGHFRLTSGKHSDFYIQCARLMQHPEKAEPVCQALADQFRAGTAAGSNPSQAIEVVIGPATGAILMAYEVARALGPGVRAMFTERENGVMTLRHGFSLAPGERVLVVEDVVTTGGSVQEVIDVVKGAGGQVVGIGALVDRSGGTVRFEVPFKALATITTNVYEPEDCPLCRQGLPAVKPGSRQV
ncbi:MAG: orotate phosphoribosyltransferase [Clostridia bacterium]|nr:orotate phosphoribosyltransferase [Clostridia bacterium]